MFPSFGNTGCRVIRRALRADSDLDPRVGPPQLHSNALDFPPGREEKASKEAWTQRLPCVFEAACVTHLSGCLFQVSIGFKMLGCDHRAVVLRSPAQGAQP